MGVAADYLGFRIPVAIGAVVILVTLVWSLTRRRRLRESIDAVAKEATQNRLLEDGNAAHVPGVGYIVERYATMHGLKVVPHYQMARFPFVPVNVFKVASHTRRSGRARLPVQASQRYVMRDWRDRAIACQCERIDIYQRMVCRRPGCFASSPTSSMPPSLREYQIECSAVKPSIRCFTSSDRST